MRVLPRVRPSHRGVQGAHSEARGLPEARGGMDEGAGTHGFPNLLVLVPEEEREGKVATAVRSAVGSLHVSDALASSFPLYVASEDRLTELGMLGRVWWHVSTDGERLSLPDLPGRPRDLYRPHGASGATSPTPIPATAAGSPPPPPRPGSTPCRPDMPLEAAARSRAKRGRTSPPAREGRRRRGRGTRTAAGRSRRHCGTG